MSRQGICHIWFRGRHIPPSMPYREARSVAESSEGPTASKSDGTGRNPWLTRLVRRSSATSGGTAFSPVFKQCSGSPIPTISGKSSWDASVRMGLKTSQTSETKHNCQNSTENFPPSLPPINVEIDKEMYVHYWQHCSGGEGAIFQTQ